MNSVIKSSFCFVLLLIVAGLSACASVLKPVPVDTSLYYIPEQGEQRLNSFAPVFLVEDYLTDFNRIGAVRAASDTELFVDPETPVFYAEERTFATDKGRYKNLLYRVHFQEVPSGFSPYYLTAGKNVGLIVVVTLGADEQPLLYTLVHTCGCYLAIIPTSFLPEEFWPTDWSRERQAVYGESLPSYLDLGNEWPVQRPVVIRIRPGTHRVMDVGLAEVDAAPQPSVPASLQPLNNLKTLPHGDDQLTSFYEESGSREGHVKGSYKSRERLWMSWWALAWKIGQDKYLGKDKDDGPVFYTSLKPWARDDSDMRDFAKFLQYWGWGL